MKFTYNSGSRPLDGYTIKRGVGRGGFGEVYYATSDGGKEVALKLIRRNLDIELRGVRHCLNLKHPNLVALYDIKSDEHDDRWVVMEFVSGESLEDIVHRHPQGMPEEEALAWMRGICAGVAHLHDQGIVHRDLKPGNIFDDEGVIKIGDYGLSKFISCSRRSGQTESVGTVHYMAPEISNGRYGKEIDTYALGIILYEMLTGRVPFEGESVGEVLMKHLTAEPDLNLLSDPYRSIVERALAKDPERRFSSVQEFAAMLPGAEAAAPVQQAPQSRPQPAAEPQLDQRARVELVDDPTSDEPILASIQSAWNNLETSWRNADLHPLLRAAIVVGVVLLVVSTITVWLPILFIATFCYGIYWCLRAVIIQPDKPARPAPTAPKRQPEPVRPVKQAVHSPHQRRPQDFPPGTNHRARRQERRRYRRTWRQELHRQLGEKTFKQRLTELLGSMIVAAMVACVGSLVVNLLGTGEITPRGFTWFAVIGTLGSWAIMIPAKFMEGKVEDQTPRRFTQLVMGLLVGLAAWFMAEVMHFNLPADNDLMPRDTLFGEMLHINESSYISGRRLPIALYMGYFGMVYLALRLWTQTDIARPSRLSIWALLVTLALSFLGQMIWPFTQPAGLMVIATICLATQLASPWLPPSKRRELAEQALAA